MSSTNRGSERREKDFYPTPSSAFRPVLRLLNKEWKHWECAQGDGRLVQMMQKVGISCRGSDLNDGDDFLAPHLAPEDVIITNPPFSLAQEFCNVAIGLSLHETWMLLPLGFLGGQNRQAWWIYHEPTALFVLSDRPSFTDNGRTDSEVYAWYYWGYRYEGIHHL